MALWERERSLHINTPSVCHIFAEFAVRVREGDRQREGEILLCWQQDNALYSTTLLVNYTREYYHSNVYADVEDVM